MGTVSGTDETAISLYEPTHAVRVFLENPITVNNAPVYQVGVTSINTSASGTVTIEGAGITTVQTVGNTITINTPSLNGGANALVGAGGITVVSGAGVTLINGPNNPALVSDSALLVVTSGTNTITLSPDTTPLFTSVEAGIGAFSTSLTVSGLPVAIGSPTSGVSSINGLTGAIILAAGTNIDIIPAGNTLTIDGTPSVMETYFTGADEGMSTTTSTTFQQKLRLTIAATAGDYKLEWYYEWSCSSVSSNFLARIQQNDSVTHMSHVQENQDGNVSQTNQAHGFRIINLSAGTHDFDLDYAGTSGNTSRIQSARLFIQKLT